MIPRWAPSGVVRAHRRLLSAPGARAWGSIRAVGCKRAHSRVIDSRFRVPYARLVSAKRSSLKDPLQDTVLFWLYGYHPPHSPPTPPAALTTRWLTRSVSTDSRLSCFSCASVNLLSFFTRQFFESCGCAWSRLFLLEFPHHLYYPK